jgi:hypothetical protein
VVEDRVQRRSFMLAMLNIRILSPEAVFHSVFFKVAGW